MKMGKLNKLKRCVVKEELVALTGNYKNALILNQMIYWSERISDFDKFIEEENRISEREGFEAKEKYHGWIYKTAEQLSEETMMGLSKSSMRVILKKLIASDFLEERRNPKYKWDKTFQYRVNISFIAKELKKIGYFLDGYPLKNQVIAENSEVRKPNSNIRKPNVTSSETELQIDSNRTAIPESITKITTKTIKEKEKIQKQSFSLSLKKQNLFSEISTFWESKTSVKLRQTKAFIQKWNSVIAEVPELTVKRAVERFLSDPWRMDKPKARTASVLFKSVENIEIWGAKKTDSFKPNTSQAKTEKTKDLEINTNTANSLITYENIIKNSSLSKEEISIWEKVKEQLRKSIKPVFFTKFIENLIPVVFDGDKVTAISMSGQIASHVNARYKGELQEAFFKQIGKRIGINVLSAEEYKNNFC